MIASILAVRAPGASGVTLRPMGAAARYVKLGLIALGAFVAVFVAVLALESLVHHLR